jgi:hypothetical protein
MNSSVESFYSKKAGDVCNATDGTAEHKELNDEYNALYKKFCDTLSKGQCDLLMELIEKETEIDCLYQNAIFKAGVLEGLAIGILSERNRV